LPLEEVIAEAMGVAPSARNAASTPPSRLTPRQLEVLPLLAERLTDREIAERLFVSPRTASKHVAAILAEFGVADRRAAAAEAKRRGLT
jgi:DNA-binding NarL/FixJ family response regulator